MKNLNKEKTKSAGKVYSHTTEPEQLKANLARTQAVRFNTIQIMPKSEDSKRGFIPLMLCLLVGVRVRSVDSSHFSVYLQILKGEWDSHSHGERWESYSHSFEYQKYP